MQNWPNSMKSEELLNNTLVVVLGMHRCGTSVITRGLQVMGVNLGESLMPASEANNDKGFWEDTGVNELNIQLLDAIGHSWHSLTPVLAEEWQQPSVEKFKLAAIQLLRSRFEKTDCFGVKDPRMARTLPFWRPIFEHLGLQVRYVIACRNPANAVRSLASRDSFDLEKGYLLWLEHMLLSVRYSQGQARVFVDYDRMLQSPERELQRMASALDLPFDPESDELEVYKKAFLESSLRHHGLQFEDIEYDPAAPQAVVELSRCLFAVAAEREDDEKLDALVGRQLEEMASQLYGYRLLRRYDELSYGLGWSLRDKTREAEELGGVLERKEHLLNEQYGRIQQIETSLAESQASVQIRQRELAEAHAQLDATRRQIELLQGRLDAAEQRIGALQHAASRHESPRFLTKALLRAVARRAGLAAQADRRLHVRLHESGLFNAGYYEQQYADVTAAGLDPLQHYLDQGWREGRNPSVSFSSSGYLALHRDVAALGVEPLTHYLLHGRREGRALITAEGEQWHLPPQRTRLGFVRDGLRLLRSRPELLKTFWREARKGGLGHAVRLVRAKLQPPGQVGPRRHSSSLAVTQKDRMQYGTYRVVPFYLDPYLQAMPELAERRVAVHLHLFYEDMTERCVAYLNSIPVSFDLYVSIPAGRDTESCRVGLSAGISRAEKVVVESAPNRGRDIAPFIVQFGARLAQYDYIAHFHTKKSPHCASLEGWFDSLMDVLCGDEQSVAQIFRLLDQDGKVVFPAGNQVAAWDAAGWSDNREIAKRFLERYSDFRIEDFPSVEFPQGTMFWARAACLREFLTLPLRYEDFPEEPIGADATLAHALERLILIFTTAHAGRNYRLESPELSREPQDYYEERYDYSDAIVHDSIKVLAYYLPQFHPTPENDEWHGEGFTEWYKVRSANPLFQGHYQQHVPHPDVGYYHLDSPQQLVRQAEQMRQAGVHGLIFYHYWFSGRLILEKPAQMLLANPHIDMPFSFCWANENWTRRWDGNEREILLGQVYSPDDARAFIRYLLPFFKDPRYIRVEGRPVLFVYRPSSMEHCDEYLRIWREECEREGVARPYVVATLTRGATSPHDFNMDAAVERVLHDWTEGAVADIRSDLQPYWPLNGSVLDYTAVADHYMGKELDADYTLFRSLVPTWDNTARYGSHAFLLNAFTPQKMQEWMESLIRYSEANLPEDRRFVVVNAWNEWAEGAHLEPDTRFGYGYLNAIGRALCDYGFAELGYLRPPENMRLRLQLSAELNQHLQAEPEDSRAFLHCLAQAAVFGGYRLVSDDAALRARLQKLGANCEEVPVGEEAPLLLSFEAPLLFPARALDAMVRMAIRHEGFHITANLLNEPGCIHDESLPNASTGYWQRSGMEVRPKRVWRGYKVCAQAPCFRLQGSRGSSATRERVSTVIRFHQGGSRQLLLNALYSLLAQRDCHVQPWLALQDMSDEQVSELRADLARLPWQEGCQPVLRRHASSEAQPDLRSLLLNDTLKAIGNGFAAFLDYDDVLFPDAYATLLERLKSSGKNASFGRVYSTTVDAASGLVIERKRVYDFGHTHEEFMLRNHAPLHSFMLNLDRIDLERIHHYDDMKYMEDYYLTLQVFTPDGTDWASLREDVFIGDYIHRRGDATHTLAISDKDEKKQLLANAEYRRCEERIVALRRQLMDRA